MQFTDTQLDQIAARHHRTISDRNAFRQAVELDYDLPPHERRFDYAMIAETKAPAEQNTATAVPADVDQETKQQSLVPINKRLGNPLQAAEQVGLWLHRSGMFGCSKESGNVIALTCFSEGISVIEFFRRYHLIPGKPPTMRADFMQAEFQRMGGTIALVRRDESEACADFTWNGNTTRMSVKWDELKEEPFCYTKKNELSPRYATPFSRTQQLWARLVSDSIRAICPGVNSGAYTPEEMLDTGDVIDGEASPVSQTATPAQPATNNAVPQPSNRLLDRSTGGVSACAAEVHAQQQAAAAGSTMPGKEQGSAPAAGAATPATGEKITRDQLVRVKEYKDLLEKNHPDEKWKSGEKWKAILGKLGVAKAGDLDVAGGERLIAWLVKQKETLPTSPAKNASDDRDQLDKWADGQMMPEGAKATAGKQ